jgi:hypothetical protein
MGRRAVAAGVTLACLVMVGVVVLIVVAVATYGGGPEVARSPGPAAITRPAITPAKAAYYVELMDGADAARCTWIRGTVDEFECVFRKGRSRARARVSKPIGGMDERIDIGDCEPITAGARQGGGDACHRKRPGG